MKPGIINKDSKELFISYVSTIIECYKVFVACLLVVFVPQYCEETKTTCTLKDNFSNLSRFNEFVLFYNFFTLIFFIYLYYIQSKRETYFITHLEINPNKPDNSLKENLSDHSKILNKVSLLNRIVFNIIKFCTINFYINVVFSSILIFYYYYDGFRSVSTLLTSVLLVSQKLYNTYSIINKSCVSNGSQNESSENKILALSLSQLEPVSFNDIDPQYLNRHRDSIQVDTLAEGTQVPNSSSVSEAK
jgi:hypothetical protein